MKSWLSRLMEWVRASMVARGVVAGLVLALLVAVGLAFRGAPNEATLVYTELAKLPASGLVAEVNIEGDHFGIKKKDGTLATSVVDDKTARSELIKAFAAANVPLDFEAPSAGTGTKLLTTALPIFAMLLIGVGFIAVQRSRTTGHFVSGARGTEARFSDVAGMDEVKEALVETVDFLRSPESFGRLGGRAPRGVLLTGQPGTGKTLLARACATEAGVPFLSASGSSFQEMFVGVGASRVRSLFAEARKVAPCIVFIDEIDAVGRARGKNADSASADHDQTLNQLLVEMDGFDHTTGIVVIASTNRADILDTALLRPGRFDRQIVVPLPDLRGRQEILGVHARPIALSDEVDLGAIARGTPGFSGADLANLLNEAAILAAREGAEGVESAHLERARDLVLMGAERRGFLIDDDERYATAVHEAGHVAVGVVAPHADPVHKVSILPRGRALGVTHSLPEKDRLMYRREYLEDQLCLMMGGRAAEVVVLRTMTAGAADDIQRATSLARKMVAELGMSELGPISLGDPHVQHSQVLLDRVEETARRLVESALDRACAIVTSRRAQIEELASELLLHDTLGDAEIMACFPGDERRA
jgi:cell division protease FtsH